MAQIKYQVTTGKVWIEGVLQPEVGYSGHGPGLNNSTWESMAGIGPIPEGLWQINPWEAQHGHLGVMVAHLTPLNVANTYGRSGFYFHGDNAAHNHTASDGCIVLDHNLRQRVKASGATRLWVIR